MMFCGKSLGCNSVHDVDGDDWWLVMIVMVMMVIASS